MADIKLYPNLKSPPKDAKVATGTAISPDKFALDVSIAGSTGTINGSFSPSGLKIALLPTTMDVTDVAVKLPATPLANRNALSVVNLSNETLYIGNSNVTADNVIGTTSGWPVGPNEGFNLDITDDIEIYGRAEAGKTIRIKVLELA